MWYAGQMPMSAVFLLGGLLIAAGIGLVAGNALLDARRRKKPPQP